jgi:hypothetical protein
MALSVPETADLFNQLRGHPISSMQYFLPVCTLIECCLTIKRDSRLGIELPA